MRHPALFLTLALSAVIPAAHAATVQPKAQQLAVFKVAALARANVTPVSLRASGVPAETVTIPADYLYKRDLRVQAYDLDAFLKARIPNVAELAAQGAQVMFWCRDGYAPTAKLADVLGHGGLLAVADADAPAGVQWPDAPYKTTVLKAPEIGNYVVWRAAQFPAKPQPWGLETIYILPAGATLKK
ncbi:hypothetical protein [Deinococcus actinosclerus]|uniref:Rhodanese domain-containing protein n=1 Tax=Deinococcus actinosclerus TaxID=1768108 RepID=A0ABM5X3H6_9DEIO|nr:hypothetical protein [Deinococcus actinosclerus]ALW88193.1 hypothetical protein AUC44_04195 [Deinococcus actinosclerus]